MFEDLCQLKEFSRSPTVLFVSIVCSLFTAFLTLYKTALFKSLKIVEEQNVRISVIKTSRYFALDYLFTDLLAPVLHFLPPKALKVELW